ncbi:hypothetical protein D9613_008951 [Agrocybe pediades]|uniref:MARVEL domain-containing protein n=1 Tax=Agrocybe pediades TaxID=84607 RepID=A0A8H4QU25_9AGAR|nr:hypothetical protein D9613_008951 [Agrocybe pediades]
MVQDISSAFRTIRMVLLGTTMVFSVIVLTLGAAITVWTSGRIKGSSLHYPPYAVLAVAIAALTLVTVPLMLFFSIIRARAVVNMNAVEIVCTSVLWILWLATGSFTIMNFGRIGRISDCAVLVVPSIVANCHERKGMVAFEFLTWALLTTYNILLLTVVIRQQARGTPGIWTSYVTETDFGARGPPSSDAFASQPQLEQKVSPTLAPQDTPMLQLPRKPVLLHPMRPEPQL